jgi:hypothetical protein
MTGSTRHGGSLKETSIYTTVAKRCPPAERPPVTVSESKSHFSGFPVMVDNSWLDSANPGRT